MEEQQSRLAAGAADIAEGRLRPSLPDAERFNLALGITYHAGQVQLLKRLHAA